MKLPTFISFLIALTLTGCGTLIPTERKQQVAVQESGKIAASHAQTIDKTVDSPAVPINVRLGAGSSNVVNIVQPPTKSHVKVDATETLGATGSDNLTGNDSVTIPFAVKVILLAIGIGLLFAVIAGIVIFLKRNSAAAAAAFSAADGALASSIGKIEARLHTESDPKAQAALLSQLNDLNKERGKLAGQ